MAHSQNYSLEEGSRITFITPVLVHLASETHRQELDMAPRVGDSDQVWGRLPPYRAFTSNQAG